MTDTNCIYRLGLLITYMASAEQYITTKIMVNVASNYQIVGKLVEKSLTDGESSCSIRYLLLDIL